MKRSKLTLIVVLSLLVLCVAGFTILSLIQKAKYDEVRETLTSELGEGLNIVSLDKAKLDEVRQWHVHSSDIGDASVHAEALQLLDKKPTVKNLVELLSSEMQPYAWLDWQRNKQNLDTATVLAVIAPITTDGSIHVSADGSTAIIFVKDGIASVFTDTQAGLLDEIRHRDQPGSS